ncbi:MAG: hypothetical protein K8T10_20550 [Candidatus Eremiobacteraeota bacterium]|nr:hypothetical protein [Candidatus Eremiobacteraeota bacterium]
MRYRKLNFSTIIFFTIFLFTLLTVFVPGGIFSGYLTVPPMGHAQEIKASKTPVSNPASPARKAGPGINSGDKKREVVSPKGAVVIINGEELFRINSSMGEYSAKKRAIKIGKILTDLVTSPDTEPGKMQRHIISRLLLPARRSLHNWS